MKEGRLGPIERFAFTMLLPLSIFACRLNQDTQTSAADSVAAELSSGEGAATASVAVSGTYPAAAQSAARQERSRTWSFDDMPAGVAPPGFLVRAYWQRSTGQLARTGGTSRLMLGMVYPNNH